MRSALDGKVFDRVDPVYERYSLPEGRKNLRRNLEIYTNKRPIQRIGASNTLRILDTQIFLLVFTRDGWKTTEKQLSRTVGNVGASADIVPGPGVDAVEWTLYWPEQDAWLGYNVVVKVDAN